MEQWNIKCFPAQKAQKRYQKTRQFFVLPIKLAKGFHLFHVLLLQREKKPLCFSSLVALQHN